MRITLVNQKGGVGKTTLALLLAGMLKRAKYDISVEDRDPQGTATLCAETFGVPLFDPENPTAYVVIDTPGHLKIEEGTKSETETLIANSDIVLLVTEKSIASIHGSTPMARLILEQKGKKTKAYVVFNRVRSRTTIGKQSGAALAGRLGIPALDTELPLSSAYENAYINGLSAVTGSQRDQLLNLALEIMK